MTDKLRIRAEIEVEFGEEDLELFGDHWFDAIPRVGETIIVNWNDQRHYLTVDTILYWAFPDAFSVSDRGISLKCSGERRDAPNN